MLEIFLWSIFSLAMLVVGFLVGLAYSSTNNYQVPRQAKRMAHKLDSGDIVTTSFMGAEQ